jgi:hypothetical protein
LALGLLGYSRDEDVRFYHESYGTKSIGDIFYGPGSGGKEGRG